MQFQPDLKVEIEKVLWATYVVVVCPYWWGGVPAMLKGK
jgi:putative NADPH-quinone reductase